MSNASMMAENRPLERSAGRPGLLTYLVLAIWFAAAWAAADAGIFNAGPDEPPMAFGLGVAIPVGLFALAYLMVPRFRAYVLGLDLTLLTAMQGWRVLGGAFLYFYAWDLLPGIFAFPAGFGDIAIGAVAPFLAVALVAGAGVAKSRLVAFNWLGIFDFVVAFGTGIAASGTAWDIVGGAVTTHPMAVIPLALIPGFGVPVFLLMHLASLLQLRHWGARVDLSGA